MKKKKKLKLKCVGVIIKEIKAEEKGKRTIELEKWTRLRGD